MKTFYNNKKKKLTLCLEGSKGWENNYLLKQRLCEYFLGGGGEGAFFVAQEVEADSKGRGQRVHGFNFPVKLSFCFGLFCLLRCKLANGEIKDEMNSHHKLGFLSLWFN